MSMKTKGTRLSRRALLKSTGAGALMAAIGAEFPFGVHVAEAAGVDEEHKEESSVVRHVDQHRGSHGFAPRPYYRENDSNDENEQHRQHGPCQLDAMDGGEGDTCQEHG